MIEGCDHVVEQGSSPGTLIRRRKSDDGLPAHQEAMLLSRLSQIVSLRVPAVARVLSHDALEMERIPGTSLLQLPFPDLQVRQQLAAELGTFVSQVASVPLSDVGHLVPFESPDLDEYREETASLVRDLGEAIPAAAGPGLQRFLGQTPPSRPEQLFLAHQDLGAEHVFTSETYSITGIIDFSDAAISDPALDLGLIMRDLGRDAFQCAIASYAVGNEDTSAVIARATFYAVARTIEDLHFGFETESSAYSANALRAITDLLPA